MILFEYFNFPSYAQIYHTNEIITCISVEYKVKTLYHTDECAHASHILTHISCFLLVMSVINSLLHLILMLLATSRDTYITLPTE